MLAFARRMNPHLSKANMTTTATTTATNTVGSNDEHIPTNIHPEKMLLINGNLSQEPTTPCVLNTPNTCTKNSTFFYEMPASMHTSTTPSGKIKVLLLLLLFYRNLKTSEGKNFSIILIFAYINSFSFAPIIPVKSCHVSNFFFTTHKKMLVILRLLFFY